MAKKFRHMIDMTRSAADRAKERAKYDAPASPFELPDVPYGLCITLTDRELEKLDLDDDCDVGDLVHLFAMGKVTSVSKNDGPMGCSCRVEISLIALRVEDESTEEEPDGEDEDDE